MRRLLLCLWLFCSSVAAQQVVNDVTGLNPVMVERVIVPRSEQEVVEALRSHPGPISIGGGRYSMGGQTAADGALQLDMRSLDKVLEFSPERREIRVQSGITWRAILEYIDPYDLSPQIMQSYANFTVGGSLSVNVHGRYVGEGPIVGSVKAIRVVLADGRVVDASPTDNAALFHGVIGGYGGLGVIVEATLGLAENTRIARESQVMALQDYRPWFYREVASQADLVMHNGILYPDDFSTVRAVSYRRSEAALTEPDRLSPLQQGSHLQRVGIRLSASPSGIKDRKSVV